MLYLYDSFQDLRIDKADVKSSQAQQRSYDNKSHLGALEQKIDSLYLMNLAALELLSELGVSKKQIMDKIEEIDLRDGKADGKVSKVANCSDCGHRISKRRSNCFYCGAKINTVGL